MKTTPHHKTKILPLRWLVNSTSHIATNHLVKAFDLQDQNSFGIRFKYHSKMFRYLNIPYEKWGTTYSFEFEGWGEKDGTE